MRRREFITLLGGAAAALPLPVNAQPSAKIPRIGLMVTGSLDTPEARVQLDAFRQGLRQLGYTEDRNIAIEYRGADARIERFPTLAAELVRLQVDVVLARPPADTIGATVMVARNRSGELGCLAEALGMFSHAVVRRPASCFGRRVRSRLPRRQLRPPPLCSRGPSCEPIRRPFPYQAHTRGSNAHFRVSPRNRKS